MLLWGGDLWAEKLQVHVPGGLKIPMEQCARSFSKTHVTVVAGAGPSWMKKAAENADIIAIGAAHLYSRFTILHPKVVNTNDWVGLYKRPAGILVRKGNPKNIKGLEDLVAPGLRLLNVSCPGQVASWEDITGRKNLTEALLKNFAITVPSGFIGLKKWKDGHGLDAWLTFASWHYTNSDVTDLVAIPDKDNVFRSTLVAVSSLCKERKAAEQFIAFLKNEKAYAIFQKWGWR